MSVATILKDKGHAVVTAPQGTTLAEITRMLVEHRIGAVVITGSGGGIEGIVSERDIVNAIGRQGHEVLGAPAAEVMTTKVFTCQPDDSLYDLMNVMTQNRIRHLPVVVDGRLDGIVSIGDVVKARMAEIEFEASEMKRYIAG